MKPVPGNATIGRKLFAGFLLLALVAGVVGLVASQRLAGVVREMETNARLASDQRRLAHVQVSMLKQIQATRMARENKNMMQVGTSLLGAGAGTRGAEISDLANQAKGAGGFGAGRP